jgi:tetratricopeptide (TPR) repeat protein
MRLRFLLLVFALLVVTAPLLQAQPEDEESRFKLAQGYEASGDLKNASRVYKELFDADPQSNVYFEGVRRTYFEMLRFAELLPIVEERVRRLPNDVELHSLYADLLSRNGRREDAEHAWKDAIELRPEDAMTYFTVAQSQIDNQMLDKAAATFLLGRRRLNDRTAFADQLAGLFGMLGKYEQATEEYLSLVAQSPSRMGFVMSGMGSYTTNPQGADGAIAAVKRAVDARPDYLPYIELLSWLYTEKGDFESAFETTRKLDDLRKANGSNIYAFADRALREGKSEVAVSAFDYFLATYPRTNPLYGSVLFGYARALEQRYRASGSHSADDAAKLIERYQGLVRDNAGTIPAAEAVMRIARLQAEDLDDPRAAVATIVQLRKDSPKFPSLPEAVLMQGDLLLRLGQFAEAQQSYQEGAATIMKGEDGERYRDMNALRYAETLFYSGEFKQAVDSLSALTRNTTSEVTNDALEYLFLLQENFEKNDAALKHYATGRLLLVQHEWEKAIQEMEASISAGVGSALVDEAMMGKADAQESLGKIADAIATLLDIPARYPDGTLSDRALFHAAELVDRKQNDGQKAIELYTRLLTEYPASHFVTQARQRIRALRGDS